jgi:hypothetical protein
MECTVTAAVLYFNCSTLKFSVDKVVYVYILFPLYIVYMCKFLFCRAVNFLTNDQHGYYCFSKTGVVLARSYCSLCLGTLGIETCGCFLIRHGENCTV